MQVFLGGTSGKSTWRKDIAIPLLETAGIGYFNPQLGEGEWTAAHQQKEAEAKAQADVWLFVISEATRGVASLVEAAYRIGTGGPIVLVLRNIGEDDLFDGAILDEQERKDLNRGRAYLREVAEQKGVTVLEDIAEATKAAIDVVIGKWIAQANGKVD
ncbi:MAG: nucleoside 2-deoxyribosyltransferase domain-containing protein [Saprospiraceae bacterium]|jgi:hypothetical protein|nr:nucleoside 2-deoxyribosyltransferase domain-containing protein [Saprospiraceae bacterium]